MSKFAISQNNISPEIMNTTQVSKNGISIYNIKKDRMIHYKNPYGTAAKRAYVQLIDSGINPEFILPIDLKHRGPSHTRSRNTFTRDAASTVRGGSSEQKQALASHSKIINSNLSVLQFAI